MIALSADDFEFRCAPLQWGYDSFGMLQGPPTGGWLLVQVVPKVLGGGSYMTGPAGQDHRIGGVGTDFVGVFARPMSLVAKFERDVIPELETEEKYFRSRGVFDKADMLRERVYQIRSGNLSAYKWVPRG